MKARKKVCESGEEKQEHKFVHEIRKNYPWNQMPLAPAFVANSSTSDLIIIGFGGGVSKCL